MRRISEKQSLYSKYMFTPGSETFGNGVKSARKAGYKGEDNILRAIASQNLTKLNIQAEKQRIQAETKEKLDITVDECIESLAFDVRDKDTNKRDKYKAMDLLGNFCGWNRDNAPNSEKEAAIASRMSAEEREQAITEARARTDELSKPILAKEM